MVAHGGWKCSCVSLLLWREKMHPAVGMDALLGQTTGQLVQVFVKGTLLELDLVLCVHKRPTQPTNRLGYGQVFGAPLSSSMDFLLVGSNWRPPIKVPPCREGCWKWRGVRCVNIFGRQVTGVWGSCGGHHSSGEVCARGKVFQTYSQMGFTGFIM